MMKYIKGKLLTTVLLGLCIIMFITLAPDWVSITLVAFGIAYCVLSMVKTGFFH